MVMGEVIQERRFDHRGSCGGYNAIVLGAVAINRKKLINNCC
jgi:hypothetical protein